MRAAGNFLIWWAVPFWAVAVLLAAPFPWLNDRLWAATLKFCEPERQWTCPAALAEIRAR